MSEMGCQVTALSKAYDEVDFAVRLADGQHDLIQVCQDIGDAKTRERELRALEEARQDFPNAKLRLLVLERSNWNPETPSVEVQSVQDWLLGRAEPN